jgi:serine/threonine protein kinase KIN1/2
MCLHSARADPSSDCAPEILDQRSYCGPEVDVWGLGVLLYTMLVGKPPHRQPTNGDPDQLVSNIRSSMERPLEFPSRVSSSAQELIGHMLTVNVDDRIDVDLILKTNWLVGGGPVSPRAASNGPVLKKKPSLLKSLFGSK